MQLILEQKNTTAVVATGNKDFALHCDMVVLLEKGKIVSVGKPVDVINTNNGS
jgi:ABC-type sulfate/molybdate transport systems ATPase subunit